MVQNTRAMQREDFDAVWQFEIQGRKFEQIENPFQVGILQSQKCYFLVFYKHGKCAIVLWRGKDQGLLDFKNSVELFKQTKFRLVKNGLRAKGLRSQSTVSHTAKLGVFGSASSESNDPPSLEDFGKSASLFPLSTDGMGGINLKRASNVEDSGGFSLHKKFTFRPIDQVQKTVDPLKLKKEFAINMEPFKRDEHVTEINLRSIIEMDSEPMFFLQGLQGAYIVTTNEYLQREPFESDDGDEQYVMMFQIIGVSGLNQRAREVPPFKTSLTTSGLYLLVTKRRVVMWAGSDYFGNYLSEDWTTKTAKVISDELLTKLIYYYDQS